MKTFDADFIDNPTFNTVNGLSNKTFDPANIVSGRGASEDQLKVVGDVIVDLQEYVNEYGCQSDPYAGIRQQLDELQAQQEECCQNRVTQENLDAIVAELRAKLTELETQIEECCGRGCFGGGGTSTCDGNTITVSFAWNGANPFTDGGQATAVSADTSKSIVGFFFLAYDSERNIYYKRTTAWGQDWVWSINTSGAVTASAAGTGFNPPALAIIAIDENGCEGILPVSLPSAHASG